MSNILILGATGFVGRALVPALLERGHRVRCLVRDRLKSAQVLPAEVEIASGDVLDPESLAAAVRDIDTVYYLIHSMKAGTGKFRALDSRAAENVAGAARKAGAKRIVYLGGLGKSHAQDSAHLRSRHEVGDILRSTGISVTEFRAAVIVGKGGLSFEMIHHLVNRLPVMICPRWVYTKTQPIAVKDVISYLVQCLDRTESEGRIIDIGGPDIMSYGQMMQIVARTLKLKRYIIRVPVLTPRLSSYWVNLVTPVSGAFARSVIDGLKSETICENNAALEIFDLTPMDFKSAVKDYLHYFKDGARPILEDFYSSHLFEYSVERQVEAKPDIIFRDLSSLGGEKGYHYANWLWELRGYIDRIARGIGYRKKRPASAILKQGDTVDFWKVEEVIPNRRIRLAAEMKVPGFAWQEFEIEPVGSGKSLLRIRAVYYPHGLPGILYWLATYPAHTFVFNGMSKAIANRCERTNNRNE